jgi:hypothetical protein
MKNQHLFKPKIVKFDAIKLPTYPISISQLPALGDRKFITIQLQANTLLEKALGWTDEQVANTAILLLILDGSLVTPEMKLERGSLASLSKINEVFASQEGCTLGLITWSLQDSTISEHMSYHYPQLLWYDKYEAWVGKLNFDVYGSDFLFPWNGYAIKIPSQENQQEKKACLHIHKRLKNLIFVQGSSAATVGYLVVEDDGHYIAWPLRSGDVILVQPGVKHNLVSADNGQALQFFVFNDTPSDYQEPETSDYHVLDCIPWHKVTIASRPHPESFMANVGVA